MYAVRAKVTPQAYSPRGLCQAIVRLDFDGQDHSARLTFRPAIPDDCDVLHYLPYVGDDRRLHIWDVELEKDVELGEERWISPPNRWVQA